MSAERAAMEETPEGVMPSGAGWFKVNLDESVWRDSVRFGRFCSFENPSARFGEFGVNVHVLAPGQPACLYHSETVEEAFLVLSGACKVLIEEEEVELRAWDFVHCPPGARHVFVGAGEGPCAILMMGARREGSGLEYPVSELAARHGASAKQLTNDPREAYAGTPKLEACPSPWPLAD